MEGETIILFYNAVPRTEEKEKMEKVLSYKTGRNVVILDARFKDEIVSL